MIFKKIRNFFFYRKCKEWKKDDGFSCYVCTCCACYRNRFLETLKYYNGKCVKKGCENERVKDTPYCFEHKK